MKAKIPLINEFNFSEIKKENQFIQLEFEGKNYLRFMNPEKEKNHSQLLFNTLVYEFNTLPKFIRIGIASPKGHNYKLLGAGRFRKEGEKIVLYGASFDYLLQTNEQNAKEISKLTGLDIKIEQFPCFPKD